MHTVHRSMTTVASDSHSTAPRPAGTSTPRNGMHDFDFIHGRWRVHNRRLRRPLSGSNEWYEFEGTTEERPLWDGQGNIEEYRAELPTGPLRGLALRIYNPGAHQWSIHWSNSATGTLDRPMIGEFRDGRGLFYGQDDFEGRTILLRFIWTNLGPTACRWEQAYSADGGESWETNWIMDFTRMA
jgi:hypothetical protein